jgi:hypothetical protein
MSPRRVRWAAALLPLVAMGSGWTAEPAAGEAGTRVLDRTAMAALVEKALADCGAPGVRIAPASGDKLAAARAKVMTLPTHGELADMGFPVSEMEDGHQAIIIVAFVIDELGNTRFAHIDSEIASAMKAYTFEPRAIATIRNTRFTPALRDGQPVAVWWRTKINYVIAAEGRMGNILSDKKLAEIVQRARAGDLKSQMMTAYLDSVAPAEVGIPDPEQDHYLALSAVNGERSALLTVTRLLGNRFCTPPPEVESLLLQHAMAGKSDLELLHATRMLERGMVDDHPEVLAMLHGAANAKDPFVQMWAAGILATSPVAAVRDAPAALESAQSLKVDNDPDAGETLAAALAANGRYAEAAKAEAAAIAVAGKMHWNDGLMQRRLAKYAAGEPWIGYLCDCDRLVPGGPP